MYEQNKNAFHEHHWKHCRPHQCEDDNHQVRIHKKTVMKSMALIGIALMLLNPDFLS